MFSFRLLAELVIGFHFGGLDFEAAVHSLSNDPLEFHAQVANSLLGTARAVAFASASRAAAILRFVIDLN